MSKKIEFLKSQLQKRILVLDGAMGTMLQAQGLKESDFNAGPFANHPKPLMGDNDVARITEWALKGSVSDADKTTVEFEAFAYENLIAEMKITVGRTLTLELTTTNLGKEEFRLTNALHSYFAISEIGDIAVTGLEGAEFLDTLNGTRHIQEGAIRFNAETDRIYDSTQAECVIDDPEFAKKICVAKSGSSSTVVWNPWIAKSHDMPDFGDDEFHGMVCVETANCGNDFQILKPGERHTLKAVIGRK